MEQKIYKSSAFDTYAPGLRFPVRFIQAALLRHRAGGPLPRMFSAPLGACALLRVAPFDFLRSLPFLFGRWEAFGVTGSVARQFLAGLSRW